MSARFSIKDGQIYDAEADRLLALEDVVEELNRPAGLNREDAERLGETWLCFKRCLVSRMKQGLPAPDPASFAVYDIIDSLTDSALGKRGEEHITAIECRESDIDECAGPHGPDDPGKTQYGQCPACEAPLSNWLSDTTLGDCLAGESRDQAANAAIDRCVERLITLAELIPTGISIDRLARGLRALKIAAKEGGE